MKDEKTKQKSPVNNSTEKKNNELWDDGMKIPDWLKTEDDK